jgi:hypothetical protein
MAFIFQSYNYKINKKELKISFDFLIEPSIKFKPTVSIPLTKTLKDSDNLKNLIFNLGMMELVSYWKLTCEKEIIVNCGYLDKEQIKFFNKIYLNGLGEFFYQNKLPFIKPKIKCLNNETFKKEKVKTEGILLPIGGGKDSTVSMEILKKEDPLFFALNPSDEIRNTIKNKKAIYVKRTIDKTLLKLNLKKGYYNGHTPFSAYLAFLTTLIAFIEGKQYIVLSNERSSNEETVKYLNKKVNHQYSKTFKFENDFRAYSKKYLISNIEYFSFLRPLYEIQIAKLFSHFKNHYYSFLSCNVANQTKSGTVKKLKTWCGSCPKCLFVFAILYPFVKEEEIFKIFNKNLFEDKNLKQYMLELIGEKATKPFECIGEKKESLVAFYLSYQKSNDYYLLKYLNKNIFPKYKNLDKEANKILNAWNDKNNLPKKFEELLKDEIRKS